MNGLFAIFSEPWAQHLGWVLLHFIWQGFAVAILLGVVLRGMAKASASARYLTLCGALILCALLPLITWVSLGSHMGDSAPQAAASRGLDLPDSKPSVHSDENASPRLPLPPFSPSASSWKDRLSGASYSLLPYVVCLWFIGVLFLTVRLTIGWALLHRIVGSGLPLANPLCLEKFEQLKRRMQVSASVRLLESVLVEVPTLIGWLRPTILIPASILTGLTPPQLEAILAHELAHVRRHDYLVNLCQTVVQTILFYHPTVWWICRELRQERENCCDDIALEIAQDRVVYASALAFLEEHRTTPFALAASGGSLLQRIKRMAGAAERRVSAWPHWALIVTVLFALYLAKGMAEKVGGSAQLSDDEVTALTNDLRIEDLKVQDVPLDQFIQKISRELADQDPKKWGIKLVSEIPPGEPPLRVTMDFSTIPHYRANLWMILQPLKKDYPVRVRQEGGTTYIRQLPADEVAFNKKAMAILIDVDFRKSDPVTALKSVQTASASKGFAFDLDLKAIELSQVASAIDLKAKGVSVDQALRSIFYLADLHPQPLLHYTGYLVQPQTKDATQAETYLDVGLGVRSFKAGSDEEKLLRDSYKRGSPWPGPSVKIHPSLDGKPTSTASFSDKGSDSESGLERSISFQSVLLNRAQIQVFPVVEIKDSHGKIVGRFSGSGTVPSGRSALFPLPEHVVPASYGKDSELGFLGVMQPTLVNSDDEPLLPPPPKTMEVPAFKLWAEQPASQDASAAVSKSAPSLTKVLVIVAAQGDRNEVARLLKEGADPNFNQEPEMENALFAAAKNGRIDVVKLLLQNGANPDGENGCGNKPVNWVLDQGNLPMATTLREAGAKVTAEQWAGATGDLVVLRGLVDEGVLKKGKTDEAMKSAVSLGQLAAVKFLEGVEGKPIVGKFLVKAAASGNIKMLDYILSRGADLKTDGGQALYMAVAFYNQPEAAKFLLSRGVDPNLFSVSGKYPLSEAGNAAMVKVLLDGGANPNPSAPEDDPLIHAPDVESVRLLVQHGANLHPKFRDGLTLLRHSVGLDVNDRGEVIAELIKQGAEFDSQATGPALLVGAAQQGKVNIARTLLDAGVSPDAYSDDHFQKKSALVAAGLARSSDVLRLLLDRGAHPSTSRSTFASPLGAAMEEGRWESVELLRKAGVSDVGPLSESCARGDLAEVKNLIKGGADVNEVDEGGKTPLIYAVRRCHPEIAEFLLQNGANLNHFTIIGITPQIELQLLTSSLTDQPLMVKALWDISPEEAGQRISAFDALFKRYPANPNYQDAFGQTALHRVAMAGNTSALGCLLGSKADVNLRDREGNTPIVLAASSPFAAELVTEIYSSAPPNKWNTEAYVADRLIEAGAKLDLMLPDGQTVGEAAIKAAKKANNAQLISILQTAQLAGSKRSAAALPKSPITAATSPVLEKETLNSSAKPLAEDMAAQAQENQKVEIEFKLLEVSSDAYEKNRAQFNNALRISDDKGYQKFLRFLNQCEGIDLASVPRVTAKSDEKASISVEAEFKFPTGYDSSSVPIKFETRQLGVKFDVVPKIVGQKIAVNGILRSAEFMGMADSNIGKLQTPNFQTREAYISREMEDHGVAVIQAPWQIEDRQMMKRGNLAGRSEEVPTQIRKRLIILMKVALSRAAST